MAEAEGEDKEQKYQQEAYQIPKCNIRIEELAKPNKHQLRFVYVDYKRLLPERNKIAVLNFIQEEFAKSPEEIEENFNNLLYKATEKRCRKLCRKEAKTKHLDKLYVKKQKNMLKLLKEILKRYMTKAYFNPKQIIMTNRLRRISNVVLKELCGIRGIAVPSRESTSIRASLMFAVSDYFAFCIDTIYYELQVKKVREYENIKQEKKGASVAMPEAKPEVMPDVKPEIN